MHQRRIVINGKTYNSLDEMPEDVRRQYEEAARNMARNGEPAPAPFPDVPSVQVGGNMMNVMNAAKFVVNGQTYDSLDQLPPEARAKYEQALGALDKNQNGIPDFVEGMLNMPNQTTGNTPNFGNSSPAPSITPSFNPTSRPVSATIEPESSGNWMLILAGIILVGVCLVFAAAGIWYFFLR